MNKIDYYVDGSPMRAHDAAILSDGDDLAGSLAESVVQTISTEIEVKLGGVTVHLAMLLDPDHWEEDWREAGVEDVEEFLAGQVSEWVPSTPRTT